MNEIKHIDPVCGMTVDPATAAGRAEYQGQTYYFCAVGCQKKFVADPRRYLNQPQPALGTLAGLSKPVAVTPQQQIPAATTTRMAAASAVEYICPMDPEIRQTGPGACPKCGMALEPATFSAPQTKTEYVCPMHPEVVRDAPGVCPICGMALELRVVTL